MRSSGLLPAACLALGMSIVQAAPQQAATPSRPPQEPETRETEPPRPPRILQIYRDTLVAGREADYFELERGAVRTCVELGCPHPYLALESLTEPREVWFLNGYATTAEQEQVAADYGKNTPLLKALDRINKSKDGMLVTGPTNVFARHRPDLGVEPPWTMGQGRFLVIQITTGEPGIPGTVFETSGKERYVIVPASTLADAREVLRAAGLDSGGRILAVRPDMSLASASWTAIEPDLWRSAVVLKGDSGPADRRPD